MAKTRTALACLFEAAAIVIGGVAAPDTARADDAILSAPRTAITAPSSTIAPPAATLETPTTPNDAPAAAARTPDTRREVVLAFGYGALVAPRGIDVYTAGNTAESTSALDGISIDALRRVEHFSYGARFWYMGDSSDGRGASAHVLTRVSTVARFHPWILRTLEPWVGVELGLAMAEDFAVWDKTDKEAAHRATTGVRPAFAGGLEAGAQLRLGTPVALGLRGGLLYMGFDSAPKTVADSPAAPKFVVYPTDYGRRIWFSMALTAELTVPD